MRSFSPLFNALWALGLFALAACNRSSSSSPGHLQYARDFNTPQGAILCLEEAYRKRDIEAAVRSKHFPTEARLMLKKIGKGMDSDEEIITKTADVLEFSFRKHTEAEWPDFTGLTGFFIDQQPYADGIVIVTEKFIYPDGGDAVQKHYVAQTPGGWRVLNLVK